MLGDTRVYREHDGVAVGVQVTAGRRDGRENNALIEKRSFGVEDRRRARDGLHAGGGCYVCTVEFGHVRTLLVAVRIAMGRSLVHGAPIFTNHVATRRRTLLTFRRTLRTCRRLELRVAELVLAVLATIVAGDIVHVAFSRGHAALRPVNPAHLFALRERSFR